MEETPVTFLVSVQRQAVESAPLITRLAGYFALIRAGDDRSSRRTGEREGRVSNLRQIRMVIRAVFDRYESLGIPTVRDF